MPSNTPSFGFTVTPLDAINPDSLPPPVKHKLYKKIIKRVKRYHAHDEANVYKIGDNVTIQETKPISKMKTWITYNSSSNIKAKGQGQKFRFVGRERAYHGMNIGATSVGGMINNVKTFASVLMPGVLHMRHTHLPEHKFISGQPETGAEIANDLERICENFGGENIAACIVEPVAGSTGCLVPPKGYLQKLREICDKHGILLIFDEVICGWGKGSKGVQ